MLNLEDKKARNVLNKVFKDHKNFIPALVTMAEMKNYGTPHPIHANGDKVKGEELYMYGVPNHKKALLFYEYAFEREA